MIFGPGGRDHDSQNQLFGICAIPTDSTYFKEKNNIIRKYFGDAKNSAKMKMFEKTRAWKS